MSEIKQSVVAIANRAKSKTLGVVGEPPSIPATSKSARPDLGWKGKDAPTGGLSSPLTESAAREYHPDQFLASTDGLYLVRVRAVKKITMTDGGANTVILNFTDQTVVP